MSELSIASKTGNYPIYFVDEFEIDKNTIYLIDENVANSISHPFNKKIQVFVDEKKKNLSTVEQILISMSNLGHKKNNTLNVIGGGFTQDLGTLASSLYMRGVDWVYWPTTLAAMGDSCIGGKSSINVGDIKNLIGNFHPPKAIFVSPSFTQSLPKIELLAGISEIIKICYAHSEEAFTDVLKNLDGNEWMLDSKIIKKLIYQSIKSKKYFVEIDEFDIKERKLLNFGHTFGHALESATNFAVPHGVAVLIGMIAATNHEHAKINKHSLLLKEKCLSLLELAKSDVKSMLAEFKLSKFSSAIKLDKKNNFESLALILPDDVGLKLIYDSYETGAIMRSESAIMAAVEMVNDAVL